MKQILLAVTISALIAGSLLGQQIHSFDVKIGQRIKLRDMGGPNVQLIVDRDGLTCPIAG